MGVANFIVMVTLVSLPRQSIAQANSEADSSDASIVALDKQDSLDTVSSVIIKGEQDAGASGQVTAWDEVTGDIVRSLRLSLISATCLPGLRVGRDGGKQNITLSKGKLIRLSRVRFKKHARLLQENENYIEVEMQLSFKDLLMEYRFEYDSMFYFHFKKTGSLLLLLEGKNVFNLVVSGPKSIESIVKNPEERSKSFLKFKSVARTKRSATRLLTHRVDHSWWTNNIFYFILQYLSPTIRAVKSMVNTIQGEIVSDVQEALLDVLNLEVKKVTIFKNYEKAQMRTSKRDCDKVLDLGLDRQ